MFRKFAKRVRKWLRGQPHRTDYRRRLAIDPLETRTLFDVSGLTLNVKEK